MMARSKHPRHVVAAKSAVSSGHRHAPRKEHMPRHSSITRELYSVARASNNFRAISKGPAAYAKRKVRRKVYGKEMSLTCALLKGFGLSK